MKTWIDNDGRSLTDGVKRKIYSWWVLDRAKQGQKKNVKKVVPMLK